MLLTDRECRVDFMRMLCGETSTALVTRRANGVPGTVSYTMLVERLRRTFDESSRVSCLYVAKE
jgi:hypothetical protein